MCSAMKNFEKFQEDTGKDTLSRDPLRSLTPPTLRLKGVSDTDHGRKCVRGLGEEYVVRVAVVMEWGFWI